MRHSKYKLIEPFLDQEVIRSLRGRRTQSQLSKVLGYKHNQLYLWESGRRTISWQDFCRICQVLKRPLNVAISDFFNIQNNQEIPVVLKLSLGKRKKGELAKSLGVTASKLSRWLTGRTDPPLIEVFKIFKIAYPNFLEFLDFVSGPGRVASIQGEVTNAHKIRSALFQAPFVGGVAAALFTKEYRNLKKHTPGIIAKHVGISLEEENVALNLLQAAKQIEMVDGLYRINSFSLNLVDDKKQFLRLAQYWADRAAALPKWGGQKSGFGYRVFCVNETGRQRIRQAQVDYYNAITEILKSESGPYDYVMVVNFQGFLPGERG